MTTRQLALDPTAAPIVVPHSTTHRHLVLAQIVNFCHHPSVQFCDHPSSRSAANFRSKWSKCLTTFCPLSSCSFCCLSTHTDNSHIDNPPDIESCLRALDCTVLEQVAAVPTVVTLVFMQGQPTNLCSHRSTTSLRQSSCQRGPNSCPSTLCILDRFVSLACRGAPPFRDTSPFLTWSLPFPFFFVLAIALVTLAFTLHVTVGSTP